MNTHTKLGAFAVGLAALFAAAMGIGNAAGPVGSGAAEPSAGHEEAAGHDDAGESTSAEQQSDAPAIPKGLMISFGGYTLSLAQDTLAAGAATPVAFSVLGHDGRPVTEYDETHDKDLHFIAVRRDLTGFQHVHPELAPDGRWSVPLDLSAGSWRVFADFAPAGAEAITLGADVAVAGAYRPEPLPAPSATAQVDGYTVTLDGELVPGRESELTLSVSRGGEPVTDLQPYLAAYGHLVALRDGDLAYLHVHPAGEPGDGVTEPGPDITFYTTAPSAGDYRLFLDFQHGDVVRTAEFTATASDTPAAAGAGEADAPDAPHDADGH